MAGTAQESQGPGGYGSQNGNMFRMTAQQSFGKTHHHIESACSLQYGCTGNNGQYGQHNINWRFAWLNTEDKCKNK
ncbi:hypothetical protein SDC9_199912 [bioreactor metagenome]|uniref:Uncharacterized protein n=1 Tax=bioreactor metagenome TaxID=1076179 RepID=A0A645IMH3_9ZZZZ